MSSASRPASASGASGLAGAAPLSASVWESPPPFSLRDGRRAELWTTRRPATRFSVPRTVVTFHANRVCQVEIAVSTRRTFGQIVKSHPNLHVTRFAYDDFVRSYYDDVSGGVAYAIGAQDFVSHTFSPDAILVHPRGRPVVPAPGGKRANSQPQLFSK